LPVVPDTSQVFISRFRCDTEDVARGLVNMLLVVGLYPEVHEPQLPNQAWEVTAPAELVPTPPNLSDLQAAMQVAAERAGAAFEGCDAQA
jgi:hypothetical protein